MLPSYTATGSEWIRDLNTDEGRESDQIYEFDGTSNGVIVPREVFDHNLTNTFSVSFWMKHEPPVDQSNKHIKEHILCNADDHSKFVLVYLLALGFGGVIYILLTQLMIVVVISLSLSLVQMFAQRKIVITIRCSFAIVG